MEDSEKKNRAIVLVTHLQCGVCRTGAFCMALCTMGFIVGGLICARSAMAQEETTQSAVSTPEMGLVVTPFVTLSTLYDSNIFAAPSQRETDTILRLSPGVGVGYRSTRSAFNFLYTFDSERYSKHSDLNSWHARQVGLIGGTYAFTNRFTGGLSGNYVETYYPGELAPVSGIVLTRTRATHISFRPTARYQFNHRTLANFFFYRAREDVSGGVTNYISTASGAVNRDLTRRDRLIFQYQMYWYDFSTGTSPISRVFTVGWRREVSRDVSLTLVAGPRNTDGRTIADIYGAISHNTPSTTQTFAYTRSQISLAGQAGVFDTRFLVGIFDFRPTPRWSFQIEPSYYRVSQGNEDAKGYRLGFAARYWFARDWSVSLSYDYSRQHGVLASANDELILRNVAALSLTWALPTGPGHAVLPTRRVYESKPMGNGG